MHEEHSLLCRQGACCTGQQAQNCVCMRGRQRWEQGRCLVAGAAPSHCCTHWGMAKIGQAHYQALHTMKQDTCTAQETGAVPRLRSRTSHP